MKLVLTAITCGLTLFGASLNAATFDEVQSQIFDTSCALSGCHGNFQFPLLVSGLSFANIVNVSSRQSPTLDLVEPGDPDNSYLVRKVEGNGTGSRMPLGGALSASQIQLLRDWIADGASSGQIAGQAFLMTTSTSNNITQLHIINSSNDAQSFTGTLYNSDGTRLGTADVALHSGQVASQARLILSSPDLEDLFAVSAWSGPALLEVNGQAAFDLMTKLESPSGLISNTNCVRTDSVHNIEGMDSANRTFVRFINTGDAAIGPIVGTLYDENGQVIGQSGAQLLTTLAAKQAVFLNRDNMAAIIGSDWNGTASLTIAAAPADLRLLNLNFVNDETFFNFSCFENSNTSKRVYLMTNSNSQNISETHFINTGAEAIDFSGTLYGGSGDRLGDAASRLHDVSVPPGGRVVLSAADLETRTTTDAWSGPAILEVDSDSDFELMTRLTSPSGLISNTNCVRRNDVQNIEGFDSVNRTFVRFINQGDTNIGSISGTMYDQSGTVIGAANTELLTSLAAKEAVWLTRESLSTLIGATWDGEASLVIDSPDDDLRLLNLNFVNDETFFNFSCYESGSDAQATGQGTDIDIPTIPTPGY